MESTNRYCIDLKIEITSDILVALDEAQHHHREHLNKFKHFDSRARFFPLVSKFLSQYNLGITHVEIFYTPPGFVLPIHTDDNETHNNHCKINWVFGLPGSTMSWWKPNQESIPDHRVTSIGTKYDFFSEEACNLLWSAEVGRPSLVNVGIPHSVFNNTEEGRWCISFMLTDLETNYILQWDKAEQIFASLAQR